jgi:hypothetical protein
MPEGFPMNGHVNGFWQFLHFWGNFSLCPSHGNRNHHRHQSFNSCTPGQLPHIFSKMRKYLKKSC